MCTELPSHHTAKEGNGKHSLRFSGLPSSASRRRLPHDTWRTEDGRLTYNTLVIFRRDLVFGASREYKIQDRWGEIHEPGLLHEALTDTMRLLAKRHGKDRHDSAQARTYLGLPEIMQLMGLDMRESSCVELAECHQLAWLIARVSPRSSGPPSRPMKLSETIEEREPDDLPWLAFQDVSVKRTRSAVCSI